MAAILSRVFACCLQRKRTQKSETPDEHTHLIPASTEPTSPPLPNVVVVDQQKFNERLNTIVRSKEGKMVNVNARLPFNLHNKFLSGTLDPSLSSRSASTSTRPSPSLSPLSSTPHTHTQIQAHVGAPLNVVPQVPTQTRESSLASREADMDVYTRNPILNVRLVRGSAVLSGTSTRRGRARMKAGEEETVHSAGSAEALPHPPTLDLTPVSLEEVVLGNTDEEATPRATISYKEGFTAEGASAPRPIMSISPPSALELKLKDAGPISVSWGD
ncbi:hypothetical protein BDQ12DRAFT_672274 [Crucibulum laeve]|uniref:Uncharacterized protein n=1 Tax=Crucibulum laeve TaxID=68775 RepID=A0A5C3MF98_9AGAR|nr:hypothetical protein BDQ12DRAFT_672274 [Crucibulum laeve]